MVATVENKATVDCPGDTSQLRTARSGTAFHRERYGNRHSRGKTRGHLRHVRAGRQFDDPAAWRNRAGPGHCLPPGRPDGWADLGRERGRSRQPVPFHRSPGPGRRRARRGRGFRARLFARHARAGGRRQRHEPPDSRRGALQLANAAHERRKRRASHGTVAASRTCRRTVPPGDYRRPHARRRRFHVGPPDPARTAASTAP